MRWTSIALGAVSLAILDAVVTSRSSSSNVGGWLASAGKAVEFFLSPAIPAFSSGSVAPQTGGKTQASTGQAQVNLAGTAPTPAPPALSYPGLGAIPGAVLT